MIDIPSHPRPHGGGPQPEFVFLGGFYGVGALKRHPQQTRPDNIVSGRVFVCCLCFRCVGAWVRAFRPNILHSPTSHTHAHTHTRTHTHTHCCTVALMHSTPILFWFQSRRSVWTLRYRENQGRPPSLTHTLLHKFPKMAALPARHRRFLR